jgi:hypothetical protein
MEGINYNEKYKDRKREMEEKYTTRRAKSQRG